MLFDTVSTKKFANLKSHFVIFEAAGAVSKIGLSLKPNLHGQFNPF
jgi:hypothetical protein